MKVQIPEVVYHGSLDNILIQDFRPLTHFGTLKSALQRAGELSARKSIQATSFLDIVIYPVSINLKNPVRIKDGKNLLHSAIKIADMLYYTQKKITTHERDSIISASETLRNATLIAILKNKGYDGMVYRNCHEDIGKDSYIIFDSSQIVKHENSVKMSYQEVLNSKILMYN